MKTMPGMLLVGVLLVFASACSNHRVPPASSTPETGSFETALDRGLSLLGRGEYARAAAELREAVGFKPDSAKAHNYLGLCYFHEKDYGRAREEFQRATAADDAFAAAFGNLAGVYSLDADYRRAEELYRKALAISPDLVSANYSLGILLSSLGRGDEGTPYLSRGIALDPDYLEKHKDSVATFSSLNFDMKESYFATARAFAAAGNVEKTLSYLLKAREAGFSDWTRVEREPEFGKVRTDPKVAAFLKERLP